MIWLALGFALTAWACVAAYGIWAWRDDRRAARNEKRDEQTRLNASFDSVQRLILQWTKIREAADTPVPPPFPTEGDNFTTLTESNVTPLPFGKRPRTDTQPDGVA
jgi:hypothetical protein